MKRTFTLIMASAFMLMNSLTAQTNLNFESWSGNEPNNWASSNSITQASGGAQTVFKESTSPGEGSFSVKMVTGSCPDCPNFALLGPFGPPTPLPNPLGGSIQLGSFDNPGISYTQRPISVDVRYKANPANNDICGFQVELTRYNAVTDEDETIGEGYFMANADVNNWTNINVPIVYYSDLTPDRLNIWATSSIGSVPDLSALGMPELPLPTPVSGSTFYIDAIVFNLPSCDDFIVTATGTGESSLGAGDGTASVNITGGTAPYTYSWNTLDNSPSIDNLIPGYYIVTVTDANGCQKVATYYVAPGGCNISVSMSGTNSSSNSIYSGNGSVTATASGGNPPYTYQWNNGSTSSSISGLPVGTYAVLITEQNNPLCATWGYYTVWGPNGPSSVQDETTTPAGLIVYPNPSSGQITFRADSDIREIQINNSFGQLISLTKHNYGTVNLDLSSQPSGIYFYTLKNEQGQILTGRLMID
ncbi:MAG: T9SS type A sorting domain-containing protein [Flavobacteriales bacterium]|nr:T9SS type A sorting domain-containing protein [Flavobacteriales bacterium]